MKGSHAGESGHAVHALIERCFAVEQGELQVGGLPVSRIARAFGTPLYIYDAGVLERTWALVRNALPAEVDIYYSMKANPQQALLRAFLARGCGLEIASAGELFQALQAGCPPERILFAGPGKTDDELQLAVEKQLGEIHVESPGEMDRLAQIAGRLDRTVRIALRVNPDAEAEGGAMRMGGKPTPFGIDEEQLPAALDRVRALPRLELGGVHLYSGTQILDAAILERQAQKAIALAARIAAHLQQPLRTIDLGGGWGIPYFPREQPLDLNTFGTALGRLIEESRQQPLLANARFVVEPGRFLVGEAGLYVTRVLDVKSSRGKTFVIVDGGMHHHLAASGNLGQTIKRNFPVALVNRLDTAATVICDVVGPLCTPLDTLARGVPLPAPQVGDLFAIFQSGAYARTASPHGFLSHPAPAEVWAENGKMRLIRRRGEPADLLRDQL